MVVNNSNNNFQDSTTTFVGVSAGSLTVSGINNTGVGASALASITSGNNNNCIGYLAGTDITSGGNNSAMGENSLSTLTTGSNNVGFGQNTLASLTTGIRNIAIGANSGSSYTGAEGSNILISNSGTLGESHTIHIGTQGSGNSQQNACFIAGIAGVTVVSTAAVLVNTTTGQLGTVISSERYKEDIQDIHDSQRLHQLRPVTFKYKEEKEKNIHFGLIAEEVESVYPELIVYDSEGRPDSVQYHEMPALFLAEIQRMQKRIEELEKKLS